MKILQRRFWKLKDTEKKLTLTSFDDIFKNDETRQEESAERV